MSDEDSFAIMSEVLAGLARYRSRVPKICTVEVTSGSEPFESTEVFEVMINLGTNWYEATGDRHSYRSPNYNDQNSFAPPHGPPPLLLHYPLQQGMLGDLSADGARLVSATRSPGNQNLIEIIIRLPDTKASTNIIRVLVFDTTHGCFVSSTLVIDGEIDRQVRMVDARSWHPPPEGLAQVSGISKDSITVTPHYPPGVRDGR